MNRFAILTAAALAVTATAPAFAGDQLARSLGVEPGVYTNLELSQLKNAQADDDRFEIKQIVDRAEARVAVTRDVATAAASSDQLALSLGLEPGTLTNIQLAELKGASAD